MSKEYIKRVFNLTEKLEKRSQFLFGPRRTGKSSYIKNELKTADIKLNWNFLDNKLYIDAVNNPSLLSQEVRARGITEGIVVIDEVQRVPFLLNEIHMLIEETDIKFLLTGSSARKLREQGVDLLGGRASKNIIHPLVYPEIEDREFSLEKIFKSGLIPEFFLSEDAEVELLLDDYISEYLVEEIQREANIKKLPQFYHFLQIVAASSGEQIVYSNIASDIEMSKDSIREWFSILEDTLLGFMVEPYTKTQKRKAVQTSKFYMFDIGVCRALLNNPVPGELQTEYGKMFENYIAMELRAYLDYNHSKKKLTYWRTRNNFEVDFILGDEVAVETKTSKNIVAKDMKGLLALKEETSFKQYIIVCREERPRLLDNQILILPYKMFLSKLWKSEIV